MSSCPDGDRLVDHSGPHRPRIIISHQAPNPAVKPVQAEQWPLLSVAVAQHQRGGASERRSIRGAEHQRGGTSALYQDMGELTNVKQRVPKLNQPSGQKLKRAAGDRGDTQLASLTNHNGGRTLSSSCVRIWTRILCKLTLRLSSTPKNVI